MKKKKIGFRPLALCYACLFYLFLYLPIAVVVVFSFNTSQMNVTFQGFTFEWYGRMFENVQLMQSFFNTLIVAAVSTLLSVILGTLCAVGMYRFKFRGRETVSNLLYIPIVIPEIVLGIAVLAFFTMVKIQMSMATLIISHVTFSMPFVVITVRSRLAGFDPSVEEAARDLGANDWRIFRRVTLPMILPGVLSGAMLALTMSLDDVVVSFFTTGPDSMTLPIKILGMVRKGVSPDVNALSTLMILGTVLIMLAATFFEMRMEKKEEA